MADSASRTIDQQIGNVSLGDNAVAYVGIFNTPVTGHVNGLQALAFKEMNQRLHDVTEASNNTCNWILEHESYLKWQQQDHGLLWIKGNPGVGKSTLMKRLFANYTKKPETTRCGIVASFFCHGRGSDLQHSHSGVFRALLHQILLQDARLQSRFESDFRKRCEKQGDYGEKWDWHDAELKSLLKHYLHEASEQQSIHVFVDALDECADPSSLLRLFKEIDSLSSGVSTSAHRLRICVSSRHYPVFGDDDCFRLSVDKANARDIENYVTDQLGSVVHDQDALGILKEDIVTRASDVFQWAALVLDTVITAWRARKDLWAIRHDIEETPQELHELYRDIVRRVSDRDKEQFKRLVQFVALAQQPLNLAELEVALNIDPSRDYHHPDEFARPDGHSTTDEAIAERIRHLSRGLVESVQISDEGNYGDYGATKLVAQFNHQSVQDYFVTSTGLTDIRVGEGGLSLGNAHAHLARSFFTYARAYAVVLVSCQDEYGCSKLPVHASLLFHAGRYWPHHVKRAIEHGVSFEGLLPLFQEQSHAPPFGGCWKWLAKLGSQHNQRDIKRFAILGPSVSTPLHLASEYGLANVVQILLENQHVRTKPARKLPWHRAETNIEVKSEGGLTCLHLAAGNGHVETVRVLVEFGKANLECRSKSFATPLLYALDKNHEQTARYLIKHGANSRAEGRVDDRDTENDNATCLAAGHGNDAIINLLLDRGCRVDKKNTEAVSAMSYAAKNGHISTVKLLVERGSKALNGADYSGQTPLFYAAMYGSLNIVQYLFSTGKVDPDSRDSHGRTPLAWAAERGDIDMVQYLFLTGEVDPDPKDNDGRTALSFAARTGYLNIIQYLFSTGRVDPDSRDNDGRTPLSWAAERGKVDIVQYLFSTGKVDPDSRDNEGQTPLSFAARTGYLNIIQYLFSTGRVDPDSRDNDGRTPLSYAANAGHHDEVQYLFSTGKVDPESRDYLGRTPFSYAAERGHHDTVQHLFSTGKVDPDARDREGRTPLSNCAGWESSESGIETIHLLCSLTDLVDPDSKDYWGHTPLSHAVQQDQWSKAKLLLSTGRVNPCIRDKDGHSPIDIARLASYNQDDHRGGEEKFREDQEVVIQTMIEYAEERGLLGQHEEETAHFASFPPANSLYSSSTLSELAPRKIDKMLMSARRLLSFGKERRY